ncbi:MAG: hypothetical protein H0X24_22820, partial [Ktedonobacterales bacterium]|nr:hypothetical protein [Ktedonobacterales bacterium]
LAALAATAATPSAELARHALGAEEWQRAKEYSQQSAEAANQIGAHEDALRFYLQILQIFTTAPSQQIPQPLFTEKDVTRLYRSIALLYHNLGKEEQAQQTYQALLVEAQARGARLMESQAYVLIGNLAIENNFDLPHAQKMLETARQIAEEIGDLATQIEVYNSLTDVAIAQEHLPQAHTLILHAVQLARTHQQRLKVAQTLFTLSDVALYSGQWEEASAASEESIVLFASTDAEWATVPYSWEPSLQWPQFFARIAALTQSAPTRGNNLARQWGSNGLAEMGAIRLHLGDGAIGRAALQLAWQIFAERNEQRFFRIHLLRKTLGSLEAGAYEAALHEVQRVFHITANATDRLSDPTLPSPFCAMVDAHHALWQFADAQAHLAQLTSHAANKPIWQRLLPATRWCTHHALLGDWVAAYAATQQSQALRASASTQLTWFDFARYYETEALVRAGDHARAEADAHHFGASIGTNRRYRLVHLRMLAVLARAAGDHTAALGHHTAALALATALELPGEAWQIANEQSASHANLGDAPSAQAARAAATAGIAHLAAQISDPTLRERFTQAALAKRPALG